MRERRNAGGGGALASTSFRSICKRVGVVFASVAVAGATVVASPVSGAVAAEGQISELGLAVISDGSAPFDSEAGPGKDTGATNGVVRTHDTVTYSWNYRNETTGKVTFRQVLPEGAAWVSASASLCDNEDAIADNGRTLNCTINNLEAGTGSLQVSAKVNAMGNNTQLHQRVSAGGVNSNYTNTTVSAFPKFSLTDVRIVSPRGRDGKYDFTGFFRVNVPDRSLANPDARGLEALKSPVTMQFDFSQLPDGIEPSSCGAVAISSSDPVNRADGGTCDLTIDNNKIATLTITDADFSGTQFPIENRGGNKVDASSTVLIPYYFRFSIPGDSLPEQAENKSVRIFGFDPEGLSGQSNYGDGYAPGMNPDGSDSQELRLLIPSKNHQSTYVQPFSHWYPAEGTGRNIPLFVQNSTVVANEVVAMRRYVTNNSLNPLNNPEVCATWRGDQFTFAHDTKNRFSAANANAVEFYSTPINDNATLSTFDCGGVGDGAAGWYSSVEAAGGANKVTAVRVSTGALQASESLDLTVKLIRKTGIPAGTVLTAAMRVKNRGTWSPVTLDIPSTPEHYAVIAGYGQWVASDGIIQGEWTRKPSVMEPGKPAAFTFVPKAANPYSGAVATLANTNVSVKLPGCMSVAGAPTNGGTVSGVGGKADCAAEGQTITWPLGTLRSTDSARELSFTADVAFDAAVPADTNLVAVVESDSDNSAEEHRTFKAPVPVQGIQSFGASQVVEPSTVVEPGQKVTSHVRWVNASSEAFNGVKAVQVLPHVGDGQGSTVNAKLAAMPTATGGSVQVTADPVAGVKNALRLDKTGDSGINWVSTIDDISTVTAVRYNVGYLPVGAKGSSTLLLVPVAYTNDTKVVPVINTLTGSSQAGPIELVDFTPRTVRVVSAKTVSGSVDLVDSPAGSATPGGKRMNVKLSGYSFGANGVDDGGQGDDVAVTKTAVVNAAGKYSFAGVLAGKYSVSAVVPSGFEAVNNSLVVDVPAEPASVNVDGVLSVKAKTGGIKGSIVKSPDSAEVSDGVPGSVTVKVTGYGFGPDGVDNGGKGDDVAVTKTVVAKDGKYSVTGLPAGKYSVGFEGLPAGVKAGAVVSGLVVTPGKTVSAGDVSLVMPDTAEYVWDIVMAVADPVRDGMFLDMRDPRLSFTGEVNWMGVEGISTGWAVPGGAEYRPLEPIHRDAMAAFLYRMAGSPEVVVNGAPFSDIPADYLFVKEITWMKSSGVTTGYPDGSFKPHGSVNRDAMAAFMHRFCTNYSDKCAKAVNPGTVKIEAGKSFVDVPAGLQFEDDMKWLASAKISTGWVLEDGSAEYRPFEPITRDAMAAFIYRMKNNYLKKRRVG